MVTSDRPLSSPTRPLIERARLAERLQQRFERRLTLVIGGGGAGKTTLLEQAIAANGDNVDIRLSCRPSDRDPARFVAALHEAATAVLGDPDDARSESLATVGELVLAASPSQVCIVVDDTHVLDRFDAVEQLIAELPANGHVLLSGRRRPALDTARLDASGQLVEISQDDLLMTLDEQIEFANLRGIDLALLEGAEGWPAFVELAAGGSEARSRRYLEEEALGDLAPDQRHGLALFSFVGGGDDEVAEAVTGSSLDELVAELPLVRWDDGEARLHDLWGEILLEEPSEEDRVTAARAAAAVHRRRGRYDRALDLAHMVEAWDDLTTTLGAAVRDGVDGGLRADRLRRWRFRVPSTLDTDPVVVLIDGLIAREDDPTSTSAWERIQLAAAGFAECGHHELELVALLQLGYLARIRGDLGLLEPIGERTRALADVHPPARPFLAFGDAWAALGTGRPDLQLAALESIADADLPPVWRVTRDHLIAHALFNLGRPHEALEVVPRQVETLPMPIPGALVTESQCLWNAGHPDEALRQRPGDTSHRYGARDRFIAGGWNGMMFAFAGDGAAARRSVDVARSHLGEAPSPVMSAQTSGVEALIAIAEGRDDDAAQTMGEILAFVPLGHGIGEQMLRNTLAIPYVLVPSSRDFWSQADLGPSLQTMRRVAAAFVDAREDGNRSSISHLSWPDPGTIAATLPCPWAIEFSLHGLAAGRQDGRRLAAWLCEHWGEPARDALRTWVDDDELGEVARDVLTHTPTPPDHPVSVQVLGPTNVRIDGFPTQDPDLRRERVRALLVCLVLRPATTRDQLAGTLWPDQPTEKAHKNLRTTLAYLHSLLEPRRAAGDATWFVRVDGHHIRLHHDLDVDVWAFTRLLDRAEQAEREGRPHTALPLFREAIELWGGDLAEDLDHEWLDLERIHLRSRFVRAACRAAELLVATHEAGPAVDIARRALDIDRWNDRSYLALAAAYDALGDHTSARAVLRRGEEATGAPIEGARRIAARGGRP